MQIDANGWLDVAVEVDVLENSMSRQGYKPTHIVLHGTAGGTDAVAIGKYFQSTIGGANPASSHIVIGRDATIVQCVPFSLAAWGNGGLDNPRFPFPLDVNPNYYTVSIEHCKPSTDNSDGLTDAQMHASFQVVQCICDHYGIPKRAGDEAGGIISHADLDSVNRARCPGPYPFDGLWAFGGAMSGVPQGWTDDGTTLTVNGHKVVLGFRSWILTHNWDPANVPLEEEHGANPVEEYFSQTPPGGTRQLFNYCELAYTSARGVYVVGIGNELKGCRADRDQARADLKAAQARIVQLQQQLTAAKAATPASTDQINNVATTLETIVSSAQATLHYLGKA